MLHCVSLSCRALPMPSSALICSSNAMQCPRVVKPFLALPLLCCSSLNCAFALPNRTMPCLCYTPPCDASPLHINAARRNTAQCLAFAIRYMAAPLPREALQHNTLAMLNYAPPLHRKNTVMSLLCVSEVASAVCLLERIIACRNCAVSRSTGHGRLTLCRSGSASIVLVLLASE